MATTAKQAFAHRLAETLRAQGHTSKRAAISGVDVAPLAKAAGVSREMARRYIAGAAMPGINRLQKIAGWLGVRLTWLRDGEGIKPIEGPLAQRAEEAAATPYVASEALEIANVWLKLPKERREWFRELMCLEAVVASHYPWLIFGRPRSESYDDYERRVERDIVRIAERLTKMEGKT